MGPLLLALGLLSLVGASRPAPTMAPTVTLRYERGPGAESCPDADVVKEAVSQRLGYRPWHDAGVRTLVVEMQHSNGALQASLVMLDAAGNPMGSRVLTSTNRDCQELTASMTLAMSIAIDPLSGLRVPEPAPVAPRPAAVRAPPSPPPVRARPRSRKTEPWWPRGYFVTTRLVAALGSAPAPASGWVLGAGLRWPRFSASLEARADVPAFRKVSDGQLGMGLITASAVPCFEPGLVRACGLASMGVAQLVERGDVKLQELHAPYASLGSRVGLRVPLGRWLALDGCVDGSWVLTQVRVRQVPGKTTDWIAPPVALAGQLGFAGDLP